MWLNVELEYLAVLGQLCGTEHYWYRWMKCIIIKTKEMSRVIITMLESKVALFSYLCNWNGFVKWLNVVFGEIKTRSDLIRWQALIRLDMWWAIVVFFVYIARATRSVLCQRPFLALNKWTLATSRTRSLPHTGHARQAHRQSQFCGGDLSSQITCAWAERKQCNRYHLALSGMLFAWLNENLRPRSAHVAMCHPCSRDWAPWI